MIGLKNYKVVYLATPFAKYHLGPIAAFREACIISGKLVKAGVSVYSPIVSTHSINIHGDFSEDFDWLSFDEAMMDVSSALLVAKMFTWEVSAGIKHEIEFFTKANKPVYYLDVLTMEVSECS